MSFDQSVILGARATTKSAIVMFSGGKDSIACLDLAVRHLEVVIPVYRYFVKGLEYKERHLSYYAQLYGVEIRQHLRAEDLARQLRAGSYQLRGRRKVPLVRQTEMDNFLRRELGHEWIIYGYKRADSNQRHQILNSTCGGEGGGIDETNKKIYPVANWTGKEVFVYLKKNRLPLPPDYLYGLRDVNTWKGEALLWLYHNYPRDYERVKAQYPLIEAALIRAQEGTTWGEKQKGGSYR